MTGSSGVRGVRAAVLISIVLGAGVAAAQPPPCEFTLAPDTGGRVSGLVIGADALLPAGREPGHGVHVRWNGGIGRVTDFVALRAAYPDAAVLDCRGRAVLSPGFVNAHEHPATSYAFPDPNLHPGYAHRDEWRLGAGGKTALAIPERYGFAPERPRTNAVLAAMELRHLLGGATTIAGSGGAPGVIRNVGRHARPGDLALYDAEADVRTFPFSFSVVEDLAAECRGGPVHTFPPGPDDDLTFMAYVPHVGEGRPTSCAARAEVARYLERVKRRDRRYSLVHGVATDRHDYAVMREFDVTLVWSPRSNLALYGETIDLPAALESGVRIALSTDWSPSGSFNMREEVRCARRVAEASGTGLPAEALWRMATGSGAYALGLEDRFGAIRPGLRADLMLVRHAGGDPYETVLTAGDEDVLAMWVDGRPLLLSAALDARLSERECVTLPGVAPRVCGVIEDLGLSPGEFADLTRDAVPVNDVRRQAPCEP
ncbi:MAG: amidohydrolase family protein [Acidobacteria bacterium]|nr:amidohydrolase family protein [Acidobacteriota bacterium]MYA46044.1 amidohydrolase family protein [Acidobacteriota bacterium]MYI39406.1 amidohydrolase family protein [Acidobacteriota bacterium]